jgi:AmmeMemoRadiSam system protein B
MILRESFLPPGWYPQNQAEISRFLSGFPREKPSKQGRAAAAPHAGWFYSGAIAARAVAALDENAETIAVFGGHLPPGMPPLFALEDGVSTPLGPLPIDTELRDALIKELNGREDRRPDNTVEVLLPMVRFFFPKASVLWVRLPAEESSLEAGRTLARIAAKAGRNICVLGSTDLTHYGDNYSFSPQGRGPKALKWVREVNDRAFIHAVEANDPAAVLERAEKDLSSCSAGAILGAMGFASETGAAPARLLAYGTSADVLDDGETPDSFVGYAALAWRAS